MRRSSNSCWTKVSTKAAISRRCCGTRRWRAIWTAMKVRVAVTALALAIANAAAGQPVELPPVRYPELAERAPNAAGFVPAGWTLLAERRGDLNGDGMADLALLLRMNDPANVVAVPRGDESRPFDTNPHWLLVALAEQGGYR